MTPVHVAVEKNIKNVVAHKKNSEKDVNSL
jgi:hypothetical protein